jgi:hypothetical protein
VHDFPDNNTDDLYPTPITNHRCLLHFLGYSGVVQLVARQPLELVILVRVQAPEPPPQEDAETPARAPIGQNESGIPALRYAAGVRPIGSAFFTKRGFCILRYSEVSRSRLSNCCSEPALTRVEILDFGATISPLSCEENRPLSRQPSPRLKECQGISTTYSQPRLGALPDFLLECLRNLRTNRSLTAT